MTSLTGRVILVAGASSGIGRAVALAAAAAGARVALLARDSDRLAEVKRTATAGNPGADALTVVCDATDADALAAAVDTVTERFGRIDIAVNSVGKNTKQRALPVLTVERWHELIHANLEPAFLITQAVLPVFRRQHDGLLLHIASKAVKQADTSGVGYQASKAGVAALAHATMCEERDNGVRVSVIYPGMTETPLVHQRPTAPTPEELARALQPEDVARMCLAVMELPARAYVPEVVLSPVH